MPITTQLLAPLAAQGRVRGTCTQVPVQMLILGQLCLQKKTGPLCALCMAPRGTFSLPAPPALWLSAASCCHASEEQQSSMNWHKAGYRCYLSPASQPAQAVQRPRLCPSLSHCCDNTPGPATAAGFHSEGQGRGMPEMEKSEHCL